MMKGSSLKGSGARLTSSHADKTDTRSVQELDGPKHQDIIWPCHQHLLLSSRVYYSVVKKNYKCKLDQHFPTLLFPLFWQMVPNLFPGCIVDSWHELQWLVMLNTIIVHIYINKWKQTSLHALLGKKKKNTGNCQQRDFGSELTSPQFGTPAWWWTIWLKS